MRLLIPLLIPILLAFMPSSCAIEPDIYREPGQIITVRVNQEFIIATETNPPSGYMWTAIVDENILELILSTVETSEVKGGEAEPGLEQHFRCRALKKGTTEVQLYLRGPDVEHIWDQKNYPVKIR
jgi:predicted secreted protein